MLGRGLPQGVQLWEEFHLCFSKIFNSWTVPQLCQGRVTQNLQQGLGLLGQVTWGKLLLHLGCRTQRLGGLQSQPYPYFIYCHMELSQHQESAHLLFQRMQQHEHENHPIVFAPSEIRGAHWPECQPSNPVVRIWYLAREQEDSQASLLGQMQSKAVTKGGERSCLFIEFTNP